MEKKSNNYFEIKDLSVSLASFKLTDLNLCIESGSYLVLFGRVGTGKSVLVKTIAGFFEADSGEIWLDGRMISNLPPNKRAVGYVPQHNDLFPNMSVRDNIAFPMRLKNKISSSEIREKTDELLSLFGLAKIADRAIFNLSGGERKKTAIARALSSEPKILLLDEPFSMLDPVSRKSVLEIIRTVYRQTGITVIHVSHDRTDAWQLGKLCAVMEDGRIVQCAETKELFRKPKTAEIARFLGAENIFSAKIALVQDEFFIEISDKLRLKISEKTDKKNVFAVIRPEVIKTGKNDQRANQFDAIVKSVSDRGEFCEIRSAVSDIEFTIHCSRSEAEKLCIGSPVQLSVLPEDIHCIAEK